MRYLGSKKCTNYVRKSPIKPLRHDIPVLVVWNLARFLLQKVAIMGLLNKLFDLRVLVALNLRQVVQIVQIFVLREAILVNECYFLWINLIVDLHLVILELIRVNGTIFKWLWLIVQQ